MTCISRSHHQEELVLLSSFGGVVKLAFFDPERLAIAENAAACGLDHGGGLVHRVFASVEIPKNVVQKSGLGCGMGLSANVRSRIRECYGELIC